jgi:hypothetical protein
LHEGLPLLESRRKAGKIVLFFFSIIALSPLLSISIYLFVDSIQASNSL